MIARILVIFRKDLRRLWPNILLFWAVILGVRELSDHANKLDLNGGELLSWLASGLLIVLLIQQERLVGHRQYWRARPLAWQEILAAKALFLVTMVSLPQWLWDRSTRPFSEPLYFTAFLLLPAVTFAAVTSNIGQSIFAFLGACLAFAILAPRFDQSELVALFIAPIALIVILLQYSRRREVPARSILVAGIAALVILTRF